MAQHDYVIDNSTGANVRADINNALLAISSNNSGSSAPSTVYPSQFFANTSTSIMQLNNTSGNAFINLFTLAGGPAFAVDGKGKMKKGGPVKKKMMGGRMKKKGMAKGGVVRGGGAATKGKRFSRAG